MSGFVALTIELWLNGCRWLDEMVGKFGLGHGCDEHHRLFAYEAVDIHSVGILRVSHTGHGGKTMRRCAKVLLKCFPALLLVGCGGGGSGGGAMESPSTLQPPSNTPPIANISVESDTLVAGSWVELSGSASSDADGDALIFTWSLEKPVESFAILQSIDE